VRDTWSDTLRLGARVRRRWSRESGVFWEAARIEEDCRSGSHGLARSYGPLYVRHAAFAAKVLASTAEAEARLVMMLGSDPPDRDDDIGSWFYSNTKKVSAINQGPLRILQYGQGNVLIW
jgi:hypothetical protein